LALQAGWIAMAGLSAALFVASLPVYARLLRGPCTAASCAYGQLLPSVAETLAARGISLASYAAVSLGLQIIAASLALAVALVIFWRRRDDWAALATSLLLATLPQANVVQLWLLAAPEWSLAVQVLGWVTASCLPAMFYTFPNGHFVPGWTRWLAAVWVGLMAADNFWPGLLQSYAGDTVLGVVFISFFATFAAALVIRYRRMASDAERQQIKWVVFSMVLAMGVYVVYTIGVNLPQTSGAPTLLPSARPLVDFQLMVLLALSVGIAILRHRLWDIDLIINRALVYGALTVTLAVLYFGCVLVFQSGLRLVSGENTTLASVASTLLLAAIFRPLRARVQAIIDRQFYRRKYDAGQVLAAFGAVLRDNHYSDLSQATEALMGVVSETLQPEHVSLWVQRREE
jgi:hypothetical protein